MDTCVVYTPMGPPEPGEVRYGASIIVPLEHKHLMDGAPGGLILTDSEESNISNDSNESNNSKDVSYSPSSVDSTLSIITTESDDIDDFIFSQATEYQAELDNTLFPNVYSRKRPAEPVKMRKQTKQKRNVGVANHRHSYKCGKTRFCPNLTTLKQTMDGCAIIKAAGRGLPPSTSIEPFTHVEPVEPVEPEPTEPVEPTESVEPEPIEPFETIEPIQETPNDEPIGPRVTRSTTRVEVAPPQVPPTTIVDPELEVLFSELQEIDALKKKNKELRDEIKIIQERKRMRVIAENMALTACLNRLKADSA